MAKLMFSKEEELNIVNLHEAEKAASKSAEFDSTYQNLKNDIENKSEEESPDSSSDIESSEDTPSEDDAAAETSSDDNDGEVSEDTDTVAQESFRSLVLNREENIALENDYLLRVKDAAIDGIKYLGHLGIHYTPIVLKGVFKGALNVISGTIKVLFTGINTLTIYLNRRINSFENLKKEIKSTIEILEAKETVNEEIENQNYSNAKVINNLKISDSIDLVSNIKAYSEFLDLIIKDIDSKVKNELEALKHIIAVDLSATKNLKPGFMSIRVSDSLFVEGEIKGYGSDSTSLNSYYSKLVLPGDKRLIAHLPTTELSDKDQVIEAYNKSSIFLGIDLQSFKSIENIHYMTKDALLLYLKELDSLCDLCIKHRLLYESVIRSKSNLRYNFKNYFNGLIHSDEKIGLRNSFVEYVYLKTVFVDKVYMAAAMDVHDFSIRTIKNSLSFIKDNTGKL